MKEPDARSNTIQFEVVSGVSQASPNNGMHPAAGDGYELARFVTRLSELGRGS
jgi:hypothetical protein